MSLPMVGRWNDAKSMEVAAQFFARIAMMAGDGTTHHNPSYPSWVGYPTRPRAEALVRLVLTPGPDPNDAGYVRGFPIKAFFENIWNYIDLDPGEDDEAKALVVAYYERILEAVPGNVWVASTENIDLAVSLLASSFPDSLWTVGVVRAFPDHPQTPGSPKWIAEEEKAKTQGRQAHHESDPNPFTD